MEIVVAVGAAEEVVTTSAPLDGCGAFDVGSFVSVSFLFSAASDLMGVKEGFVASVGLVDSVDDAGFVQVIVVEDGEVDVVVMSDAVVEDVDVGILGQVTRFLEIVVFANVDEEEEDEDELMDDDCC